MRRSNYLARTIARLSAGLIIFLVFMPVHAQEAQTASLFSVDTTQFPTVSAMLSVYNPAGGFIHGLTPADITLLENGQFASVKELSEEPTPIRFSIVINASPSMGVRNAEGKARYDAISQALMAWAGQASAETGDDYSLFTNGGPATTGLGSPTKWSEAFQAYRADFRNSKPSLESLSVALNREIGLPSAPGLGKVILWITSPPEGSLLRDISGLTDRLQQSGVRLDIWSVSTAAAFNSEGSKALQAMAEGSGGSFLAYSGVEGIPDPSGYLQFLRGVYTLIYDSNVRQAGNQTLSAQVQLPEGTITSETVNFTVDIQPPNPMLLTPPEEITRSCPADATVPLEALTPTTQTIRALVEFPDGHPRELKATRLYIDGKMASENLKTPFDQFQWDIQGYKESGRHLIKVEAEDALGLSQQSLEIPVDIRIVIPPATLETTLARNRHSVTWAAIALAGLALMLVLYFGERKGLFKARQKNHNGETLLGDPTGPVTSPNKEHSASVTGGIIKTRRGGHVSMDARLIFIDSEGEPLPQAALPLSGWEVLFGREPAEASCVLNDASIEGLHARLTIDDKGNYLLSDLNSTAGTWINYAPVSMDGAYLEHGDIIHIGRVAFRFLLTKPGQTRIPSVEPYLENS